MEMIRDCCVADAIHWKETAMRVALTTAHPACQLFRSAYRNLTTAEQDQVGNLNWSLFQSLNPGEPK
jgi:hypothetical protein